MAATRTFSTEEEGFLYLAVILDVFSRRVVGWSMQDHLRPTGPGGTGDGYVEPAARSGADSPLGSRLPVHLGAFRGAVCGGGDPSLEGPWGTATITP